MGTLLLVLSLLAPVNGDAEAELLLRVLSYDRNLEARTPDGLRLAILHDANIEASRVAAEAFLGAVETLEREGSTLVPAASEMIPFSDGKKLYRTLLSQKMSAIYVAPGLMSSLDDIIRAAENAGVMTLAGDVAYVENGLSAGVGQDRKIVINIGAAERCGVDLDATVRQVARRVGEISPDPKRSELSEALARYRSAIKNKDMAGLRELWPALSPEQAAKVKASMEAVRSHEVALALLRIDSEGEQARVRVRRADRLVSPDGKTLVSGRLMEIQLSRSMNGDWIIDSMKALAGT